PGRLARSMPEASQAVRRPVGPSAFAGEFPCSDTASTPGGRGDRARSGGGPSPSWPIRPAGTIGHVAYRPPVVPEDITAGGLPMKGEAHHVRRRRGPVLAHARRPRIG